MKYSELKEIINAVAKDLSDDAGYAGEKGDGGAGAILYNLKKFEDKLIIKLDLRPSETNLIFDTEVGLPFEFSQEIKVWKGLEFYKTNYNKFTYYFKN